ncbi:ATP-binding protein [Filimonas effusa]|nr:tetratricopeptide repeat-containing sensor histidine kinase [Filimonas effusa]
MWRILLLPLAGTMLGAGGCRSQEPAPSLYTTEQQLIKHITDSAHHFERSGNKAKALHYHKRALAIAEKKHLPEQEAKSLTHIGRIISNEDGKEGLGHLYKALNIARSINHHALQADIYAGISAVYKQQQQYEKALHALELHNLYADSLLAINQARELAQLKKNEYRKRERDISLTITITIIFILAIITYYFQRTRKLNSRLHTSIQVRDKLFSILAHDLRGPVNNVVSVLQLMEDDPLPEPEQRRMNRLLIKQSESLATTIDSLLQWSSNQLNGIKTTASCFSPSELIDKVLLLVEGQTRSKTLTVNNRVSRQFSVLADPDHFDLIIRNLLSNAIKFSHEGGSIEIGATSGNGSITFSVTDHGTGISPDDQKKFGESNMETNFGTSGEKGNGLGLLLVKDFVQANHGRIWLTSKKGEGTTFYFSLKAAPTK